MAFTVQEQYGSDMLQWVGGMPVAERVFHVYGTGDDSVGNAAQAADLVKTTAGVQVFRGGEHPRYANLIAEDFIAKSVPGSEKIYEVRWTYRGTYIVTSQTGDSRTLWIDGWRALGTFNFPDNKDTPDQTVDIAGTAIDSKGRPVSIELKQQVIDITVTLYRDGSSTFLQLFDSLKNTRNDGEFLGVEAGKLVYLGYSHLQVGNSINLTHHFVEDSLYHLRQQVDRDEDGKVHVATSSESATYTGRAYKVFWVQPYKATSDFNLIGLPALYPPVP